FVLNSSFHSEKRVKEIARSQKIFKRVDRTWTAVKKSTMQTSHLKAISTTPASRIRNPDRHQRRRSTGIKLYMRLKEPSGICSYIPTKVSICYGGWATS